MLLGPRFGRPGLIGLAARTAVVAGTAGAVSGAMQRRAYSRQQESAEATAYEQQQQAAYAAQKAVAEPPVAQPSAAAPAGDAEDTVSQLERLAALRQQGVLSEQEFESGKAKILG